MTSVHPEESKEEAGVAGRVTDAITGAVNGAALVVLGEDLDGTRTQVMCWEGTGPDDVGVADAREHESIAREQF